jgi:hypothetical protein
MGQNLHFDDQQSMASLVGEIIHDAQKLVRQELALVRAEVHEEWLKTRAAATSYTAGAVTIAMAGILLALTLVQVLNAFTLLPLWACYGIVAFFLAGVGGIFFRRGSRGSRRVDFKSRAPATPMMREKSVWSKNPI